MFLCLTRLLVGFGACWLWGTAGAASNFSRSSFVLAAKHLVEECILQQTLPPYLYKFMQRQRRNNHKSEEQEKKRGAPKSV